MHLDEWVLSWPQLHLSFYTWHPESLLQSFWVNFTKDLLFELDVKHVFHGVEFVWILNLQVDKVGWTNQTIPCFLLSSLTWIQSWIASLHSGWCCIWRYHCQRLKPTKGCCTCFIKLGQSLVLHHDNFVHFKVTCKGLHKFGITKKLCDNTFRWGWPLNHRDIKAWVKKVFDFAKYQFLSNFQLWIVMFKLRCISLNFTAIVSKSYGCVLLEAGVFGERSEALTHKDTVKSYFMVTNI